MTRAPSRLRPSGGDPRSGVRPHAAQPCERKAQCQLSDGLGVHAVAARPHVVVIDEVDEVLLDPGQRQLYPLGRRRPMSTCATASGCTVGPDDPLGRFEPNEVPTTLADRLDHPLRRPLGSNSDARGLGSRHGRRQRLVRSLRPPVGRTADSIPLPARTFRHGDPMGRPLQSARQQCEDRSSGGRLNRRREDLPCAERRSWGLPPSSPRSPSRRRRRPYRRAVHTRRGLCGVRGVLRGRPQYEDLSACLWGMRTIEAGPASFTQATGAGVSVGVIDSGVVRNQKYKQFQGKRMNEVIKAMGKPPLDALFDY